ncbi:hypothetical protein LKO27_14990 [Tessaracoccus sp. OS52]|uniref:hypothetical protein n=1 Tax=Tessaracoccus sp. OS52 TaxID=2886691 RepID=UPI001D102995|nr:hypothetical protein [Tessaracoccus sp. OS52]MCC2594707.1 hypothetical protein [Tessaracoccus sp. OS52]
MCTVPVVDACALRRLGDQLGDPATLFRFVCEYTDMLEGRVDRLQHALVAHDVEDFQDAALSLKVASQMAGACALSGKVAELMEDLAPDRASEVRWFCADQLVALCTELRRLAVETAANLRAFLDRLALEAHVTRNCPPLPA